MSLWLGAILAVVVVEGIHWQFQPRYEAAALLEIAEAPPHIAFEAKERGISREYFRTQVEIIRSRWIMGRTVASANIKELPEIHKRPDPIEWLQDNVRVVRANDSDVFEIKYASADPESAALIVNAATRQYLLAQSEEESARKTRILKTLTQELETRREVVKTLRQQVESLSGMSLVVLEGHAAHGEERDERPTINHPSVNCKAGRSPCRSIAPC